MTVEKINSTQPIHTTLIPEIPEENEKQEVQKTSGSSKDIITALSVLAAIGAAGVAVYKHKNAKKLVEEAENKAKKKIEEAENSAKEKIEEAENKVKKAAEENEQKVKDAVEKITREYEQHIKKPENNQKKSVENTTAENQNDTKFIINTKLSDFYTKIKNSVKKLFKRTPKKEKTTAEIKPEVKPEIKPQDEAKPEVKDGTTRKDNLFTRTWNKFLGLFRRKKTKTSVLKITEEGEAAKQNIRKQLSGKTDYAKLANDLIKEPNTPAEHNRIQALYNTLAKEEPKPEDIFKGISLPDVTKVAEQDLVTEYDALAKIIKDLPVMDKTAQRFLQIRGELLNHRGYRVQPNGEIKKLVPEKINIIDSKDLRETPDLDLLTEYFFLKNKTKNLPVMDSDAQRFLQIRGELINHRNFKVMPDGKIRKITVKKPSLKDRIKNFFKF